MPMHPAPPEDLHGLVEAFVQSAQAVLDLGRTCPPESFALPTQCAGWTVHDQFSHIVGMEAMLEGFRDPPVSVPDHDHVTNEQARFVERAVELRRSRTDRDVLSELEHVLNSRFSTLRSPGLTETSILPGPFGPDEAATVTRLRTFDLWNHEQDIRTALDRPGDLDSPAAAVVVDMIFDQLPKVVARKAGIAPGHRVIFDVTGPVHARTGVRVEADESGRAWGHEMFTGDKSHLSATAAAASPSGSGGSVGPAARTGSPGPSASAPEQGEPPTTTIALSTAAFTRRAAGRQSVEETRYTVVGDDDVARRVIEALVITR